MLLSMAMRSCYGALAILAVALFVSAQTQPSAKPAAQAPDREAYRKAVRQKDPRERVNWLRKFLKDYPKSSRAGAANELILNTLVQNWPDQLPEIRDQVALMTRNARGDDQSDKFDTVADILVTHAVLLETAQELERQALNRFHEKRYLAKLKREYAEAKVPISPAALQREGDQEQASLLTTMGRIHVARGDTAAGRDLLEQAYKLDPANSDAAAALGEIALHAGRDSAALDLLTNAQLVGKLTPEQRKDLQDLYLKLHAGGPVELDAWLDRQYRQKFPESFHIERYHAPVETGKTVLAELFTGAGCPPCAGFDVAMDATMERYSERDLAVLMYHEHVPKPDPLANPATVQRSSFYNIPGTPTLAIDGETVSSGGDREAARSIYERFLPKIDAELKTSPELSLAVSASREGERVTVQARVDPLSHSSKSMRLEIVLAEKQVRYSGENGIRFHPMVVRAMAGDGANGFAVDSSGARTYDASFDVAQLSADLKSYLENYEVENDRFGPIRFSEKKYSIAIENIAIVAFVQDADTKRVLEATYVEPDAPRSLAR